MGYQEPKHVKVYSKDNIPISEAKPFPVVNFDLAHRSAINSVFGDRITGTRIPSIAAQFQYGLRSDDAVVDSIGSGSTSFANSMLLLNTGTDSDGHIGIEGTDHLRYVPGHEAYAFFTAVFAPAVEGSRQRVGLYDYDEGNGNGFFIGYEGQDFRLTRRRNGVDTTQTIVVEDIFPKESGVFNPEKGNTYKISFGYLGFATIHVEVMLPHGGFIELASIDYPNTSTETHIGNTNIPLRAEMTNFGNTTDLQLRIGSVTAGVVDGGGTDPVARVFTFALPTTTLVAGVVTPLVHFRNKDTFFGITNKITTQLILISAATDGNKTVAWGISRNPPITTPGTWADVDTDSVMEYSIDAVTTIASGTPSILWNLSKIDSFFEDVEKYLVKLRPNEWATIHALSAGANDVDLSIRWKELF